MKVLLLCESANSNDSGGRVVRYMSSIMKNNKIEIKLVVLYDDKLKIHSDSFNDQNDIYYLFNRKNFYFRLLNLFIKTREVKEFKNILSEFKPDIVHFASFEHTKPSIFINEVKSFGAKVVLQPWTMHFYCSQGFGYRDGKECNLCLSGNFSNALIKKCVSYKGIPGLIEKKVLHTRALNADLFLSSNSGLDKILNEYGVEDIKITRFPVPFDCNSIVFEKNDELDYYVYYGQTNAHKGFDLLIRAFQELPKLKLKVYPMSQLDVNISIPENVEIVYEKNWANGLKEAIVNSKAVIIPSQWNTSTEYSLCEALLLKKAVILFNVGVHKDLFVNGVNALVIEQNDFNAFVEAIIKLDSNHELRNTLGENGYKTLIETNDPISIYNKMLSIYN